MKQLGVGVAGVRSREAERIGNLALGALAVQPGLTAVELAEALTRAGLVRRRPRQPARFARGRGHVASVWASEAGSRLT